MNGSKGTVPEKPVLNREPEKKSGKWESHESTRLYRKEARKAKEDKLEQMKQTSVEEVEAERKKIEEEMQRRKERIAAWRAGREKEEEELMAKEEEENKGNMWVLDNDDDIDDDEDTGEESMEQAEAGDHDEVDPLDAFMQGVHQEVQAINRSGQKSITSNVSGMKSSSATMITVTKVKQPDPGSVATSKAKGELLQNDQDAMEYSDEEKGDSELATALSAIMKTKKKELPATDHRKIEYEEFRKDFYVEVPELAKMTPEEVSTYRIELENVKIKGKGCPKPVKKWAQCGLPLRVLDVIKKCGYEKPTPIQAQAIPAIMSGRDLIGIAKTGSGKTLAFVLPLLRHVKDQHPVDFEEGAIALILTPTRELAIQIYNECRKFCKPLKLRCVCVYGGSGVSEQIADLKRGTEIIVCTPGRMIDMLAANNGRVTNLRRITYLVLDEADRMFDMGFEPQVMKIISNIRPDRQTVMFSATFPRPMEALARRILTKPIESQIGGRSVVCKEVEQSVIVLEQSQKFLKLLELLGLYQESGNVLVFVERQESADYLIKDLMKVGYLCMALHGGMDQSDRDSTISDFKNAVIKLLVATSVAARGLDIKGLILVINYDCPNHYEDYVHRCGRTGRAGNKGNAYTFITPDQARLSGEIIKALELSGAKVPDELNELWKSYTEQMRAEGKYKPKRKMAGFSGKGYKFNEEESVKTLEKKLKQKSALGMADSDDEDDYAILTLDKKLEEVFSGKIRKIDPSTPQLPASKPLLDKSTSKNLALASAIAERIMLSKNLVGGVSSVSATQTAASSVMKGEQVSVSGAVLASQIAASINVKVGAGPAKASEAYLPVGTVIPKASKEGDSDDEEGDKTDPSQQLVRYEEEIDINDFPQQIRFKITMRDTLDDIGEYSEAYISVRGLYVPQGRQPKEGEKRLHLLIEGKSERAVTLAKQEIKQHIKEEAQKIASRVNPYKKTGRYKVL